MKAGMRSWPDAGAGFYRDHMSANALMVIPVGTLERDAVIESLDGVTPWARYDLDGTKVVELDDSTALVTYEATARRPDDPDDYHAFMTSLYVRDDGDWKLAIHQQTPASSSYRPRFHDH